MDFKIKHGALQNLIKGGMFLCIAAIIVQLLPPKTDQFNYYFEVGKPWGYELITASFDFPIYKGEEQLASEKREALAQYTPYYLFDAGVEERQLEQLKKLAVGNIELSPSLLSYLNSELRALYAAGIIESEELEHLRGESVSQISIIRQERITNVVALSKIYTPKTAYETLLKRSSQHYDEQIRHIGLHRFLSANLQFDTITSELAKKDMLRNFSLTSGVVQAGERIIDRGEIVSEKSYRLLNSLKRSYEERSTTVQQATWAILGDAVIVVVFMLLLYLYLHFYRPRIFKNTIHVLFILILILLMIGVASATTQQKALSIYIVPCALLPVIIRVFFDSRTALFAHVTTITLIAFMVPTPFEFLVLQLAAGMTAISSLKDMTQRSQLATTALWIFVVYVVGYTAIQLSFQGELPRIDWRTYIAFGVSSLLLLFSYGLIYIFEKIFGLTSSITLVELTDVNSDLMIQFSELAPGSFQHSLQVSNLATEAAKKINANSLLVRTGALYHDIGKMSTPHYFIENQQGGENPVLKMSPEEAAQAIIQHIAEGVRIAQKKGLPDMVVNFIRTHHGQSKVRYFYNTFVNENPGVMPDESKFTYPWPTPDTKETAILMMADAVEAVSRSLNEYTEESISDMVERIINGQIAEGLLKNTPLSFRDVEEIKMVFKQKMMSMHHHRIAYPEIKKKV